MPLNQRLGVISTRGIEIGSFLGRLPQPRPQARWLGSASSMKGERFGAWREAARREGARWSFSQ